MKKSLIGLALVLSGLPAAFSYPSFDPFASAAGQYVNGTTYAVGSALYHQTNGFGEGWAQWNGGYTTTFYAVECVNSNLSYSGFPANFPAPPANSSLLVPGNNLLSGGQSGQSAALNLSRVIAADPNNRVVNKVYVSFLMRVPSIGNLTSSSPIYFGGLYSASGDNGTSLPSGVTTKLFLEGNSTTAGASTQYQLAVAVNNSGTTGVKWDSTKRNPTDVLFVVLDYEFGINGNADVANLWINPSSSSFGAATTPTPNASQTGITTKMTQAADFYLLARSGATLWGSMVVSDLRIGDTWAYVTGAPEITAAPVSATTNALASVTFAASTVSAPNTGLGYQWQLNGQNLTDGPNISGSAAASLTITNVCATNAGTYSFSVANAVGSATASALLVLNPPSITQQPASQGVPPGGNTTFSVTAGGVGPLSYQWYENGSPISNGTSSSGTVFSGASAATVSLWNVAYGDSGATFYCVVTDGGGVASTSSNATLSVQNPAVASNPQNVTTHYGGSAGFSATAAGTPPFTYQWYFNGAALNNGPSISGSGAIVSGATSTNLALSGVNYLDAGNYYVVISGPGANGTATSSSASLTVSDPWIVTQPSNQTNLAGTAASFAVAAQGAPTLTYQWQKNGASLTNGANISGALTSTLTVSSLSAADAASYSVVVTGGSGVHVTSSAVTLAVLSPIIIASGPQSRSMRVGDHAAFVVGVNGTSPSFQWEFNGTPIAGATASTLALTNLQTANAGTYKVIVTNVFSTVNASATLAVSTGLFSLPAANLVVARVGDGAQTLNDLSGNTLYLDQIGTNGSYINSLMIPDTGPSAFIAAGGATGQNQSLLTLSADHLQLNFVGYAVQLPYGGNLVEDSATDAPKGIGSVNASGTYSLVFTNTGLYTPNRQARGVVTDGKTNFWAVGSVGGLKWLTPSSGSSGLTTVFGSNDLRAVEIVGTNLWMSAGSGSLVAGVGHFNGLPTSGAAFTACFNEGSTGNPNDFAVSPDGNTLYVADSGSTTNGGVQRWDNSSGTWSHSYTLATSTGTNTTIGASGLTVDFSGFTGGGRSGAGAVVYATTVETSDNRLIRTADDGTGTSSASLLASAGLNQLFRGVRFGLQTQTVASVTIACTYANGQLVLSWPGSGTLQSAPAVTGPWASVTPTAASPYSVTPSQTMQFFRVKIQ